MSQESWDYLVVATRAEYLLSNGDEKPPWERDQEIEELRNAVAATGWDIEATRKREHWWFVSGNKDAQPPPPPGPVFQLDVGDAVVIISHAWHYIHTDPIVAGIASTAAYEFGKNRLGWLRSLLGRRPKMENPLEERFGKQKKLTAETNPTQSGSTSPNVDEALTAAAARLPAPTNPPSVFNAEVAEQQAMAMVLCSYRTDDLEKSAVYVESRMQESDLVWMVVVRNRRSTEWRYIARVLRTETGVPAVALRREQATPPPQPPNNAGHDEPPVSDDA